MKLSAIIVNYNVARFCEQAVAGLLASGLGSELEVFVVDNSSTDDSLHYLRDRFVGEAYRQVYLIDAGANLGFGRANNLAAAQAKGEYILFLNPDTLIAEDTLEQMLTFADAHPDLGALGVSMTNEDGTFAPESRRGLPTPWTAFCKLSGLTALMPHSRRFGRYYMAYLSPAAPHATEVVSGACMMVRRDGRTDWFDPDYFMYGEDVDLSYRLMKEGKTNYYLPAALVHYKGESTNKTGFRYAHVFYGAMLIFLRKHFPYYAFCLSPIIALAIVLKALTSHLHAWWIDLRHALSSNRGRQHQRGLLYLGTHGASLQHFAAERDLPLRIVEATAATHPEGHTRLDLTDIGTVVYDVHDFPRRDIIAHLQATAGRVRLALYDHQAQQLIAHGKQIHIPTR
ncbi:MAG: glycosyltransferase family 2 protein [Bacteroidaceae bacterium]|nr:glycosyltransferase family 2 protein [Bacteroidaceae bacterium]